MDVGTSSTEESSIETVTEQVVEEQEQEEIEPLKDVILNDITATTEPEAMPHTVQEEQVADPMQHTNIPASASRIDMKATFINTSTSHVSVSWVNSETR